MVRKAPPPPAQNPNNDARQVALDKAVNDITKRYGDGAIMRLGESQQLAVEGIPTGSLSLDIALGVGGVPRGRITEIYGPESSGKTTICQHIVAEAQKLGGTCAYIDMEHALDPTYAARCGVDVEVIADLPAGYRRAGARDCRNPGALWRGRCGGDRLGGGPGAARRNRRRHGRSPDGHAGPPDVAGAAQVVRRDQANQYCRGLHQPAPPKDRRDVRQSGNHHRWHGT